MRKTGRQTESQRLRETLESRHESFAGKDSDIVVCTELVEKPPMRLSGLRAIWV